MVGNMRIPFFDLSRQTKEVREEICERIDELIDRGDFVEGVPVKELENGLAEYLKVKHVITCANGTEALELALKAVGVNAGDEVITTPFTFVATAEAIAAIGAVPVFADVKENDFNLDPESARSCITDKTKAILPVHIFGMPADMDEINKIASENNLKVVEDACQAVGAEYKGKKAGNLGDAAAFSFYPTKNLGAFGDGGMVTTNDDDVMTVCRALKAHGAGAIGAEAGRLMYGITANESVAGTGQGKGLYDPYKYYNYVVGGNSRLDSIQAAVLLAKLPKLDGYNKNRGNIAGKYREMLKDMPLHFQELYADGKSCFHQFAVLTEEKDEFVTYLAGKGIGTGAFYPVPLHLQKAFQRLGYKPGALPVVEEICRKSVCLPVFPELTEEETDYIIDVICHYFRGK